MYCDILSVFALVLIRLGTQVVKGTPDRRAGGKARGGVRT